MILATVTEGIFCIDVAGRATFVNPAAARMTGWDPKELNGQSQHDTIHHTRPDGTPYPPEKCPIYQSLQDGQNRSCDEDVFWRKDGTSFPVSYTSTPIMVDGVISGVAVVFRDISAQTRRERWQRGKDQVSQAITMHQPLESTLQLLADAYNDYQPGCSIAFLLRDEDKGETLTLAAGAALSPTLKAQLQSVAIALNVSACGHAACTGKEVVADNRNSGLDQAPAPRFFETMRQQATRCLALPMISANGQVLGVVVFIVAIGTPLRSVLPTAFELPLSLDMLVSSAQQGGFRGVRDLAQIAIEHRRLHHELIHQSQHDRLTGLPNWVLLKDRVAQALRMADRNHTRVAICSIDIDRLRRINENFGHPVGDELLRRISERFRSVLRDPDVLGRQGGDEFIILLPDLRDSTDVEGICRRLVHATSEPFQIEGNSISIGINIGVSIYPDHADTVEMLVQHADTALEFAKATGQAKVKVFRPDLGEKARQVAARESALRTALERNELYLVFQPLYNADRTVHGFEALLRWQHPTMGLIPPDQFIPLAEETGLILPIGDWVLRESCRQAMTWKIGQLANTKIHVNVSALQLGHAEFTKSVAYALRTSGLPPSRLELEVTESLIVLSFKKATARLQPLQDLGVSIAIDDFGTGHSSFSVLHKLPIDALKIDRSFVSRIDKDASGLSTVRAIVNLAHQLGMRTVAEGVETEAQFKMLSEMDCDYFQGFLLSKPISADAVRQLFAEPVPAAPPEAVPAGSVDRLRLPKSA
jgi:diguanylate cyclase (GGDEF)-like protein/PAS domain S-box-containing protein